MANAVDVLVHLENLAGAVEVEGLKTCMDEVQHLTQGCGHLHELAHVGAGNLCRSRLNPERDAHYEITNAFEICRRFQAGQELTGADFIDSCDGGRQMLVDLTLNQVELFLAVFDGEESHTR